MGVPLFFEIVAKPVTSLIICGCTAIWLYIQKHRLSYEDVGVSYDKVVSLGQLWRIPSAALSHISLLHLLFNMSALWSLGDAEGLADVILPTTDVSSSIHASPGGSPPSELGVGAVVMSWLRPRAEYVKASVVLALMSEVLALGIYHLLVHYLRIERYRRVTGVGYSCVVFGWMTILSVQRPSSALSVLGMFSLPVSYAPFESLVLTSLLVPNASFVGHLAGILVGYLIAWGVFAGFTLYWQGVLYFWLTIGLLHNLKTTGPFPCNFLEVESLTEPTVPDAPEKAVLLPSIPPGDIV